jgi:hypothetical protein
MTKNCHSVGRAVPSAPHPWLSTLASRPSTAGGCGVHSRSKPGFVKKYFETIATLGAPVGLFQIGLSFHFSKKHVRGFAVRTGVRAGADMSVRAGADMNPKSKVENPVRVGTSLRRRPLQVGRAVLSAPHPSSFPPDLLQDVRKSDRNSVLSKSIFARRCTPVHANACTHMQSPTVSQKRVRGFAVRTASVVVRNENMMNATCDRFVRGFFGCGETRLREYGLQRPMTETATKPQSKRRAGKTGTKLGHSGDKNRGVPHILCQRSPHATLVARPSTENQNYTVFTPFLHAFQGPKT